jgi:murein DD-endopeptidase MepM/ murein hydrolase activator NlpD
VKVLALGALLVAGSAVAAEGQEPLLRARAREELISKRSAQADATARAQALAAYRLSRKRTATFLDDPAHRTGDARAADAALLVLARSLEEAAVLDDERVEASAERRALEASVEATADDPALPRHWHRRFRPPARGAAVATPAISRDEATGAQTRLPSVQLLARLDEPVHAIAAGRVGKVAALPQGGYAVVTTHEDGWLSVLSGLRQVDVAEGSRVESGQRLGSVGRNLDGAPILDFQLVHGGRAVDPGPVLGREGHAARARAGQARHHHRH